MGAVGIQVVVYPLTGGALHVTGCGVAALPTAEQHVVAGTVVAFYADGAGILLPGYADGGSEKIHRAKVQRAEADVAPRAAAGFARIQQSGADANIGGFAIGINRQT